MVDSRQDQGHDKPRSIFKHLAVLMALPLLTLVIAASLPGHGSLHWLRIVIATVGLTFVPGWYLVRSSGLSSSTWSIIAGSALASGSFFIIVAFILNELNVRLNSMDYWVPALIVGSLLAWAFRSQGIGTPVRGTVVGTIFCVLATLSVASLTHLYLPTPPVESSYSVATGSAVVNQEVLSVPLVINRINFHQTFGITLEVNFVPVASIVSSSSQNQVVLRYRLSPSTSCQLLHVSLLISGGQYLSPRVVCP